MPEQLNPEDVPEQDVTVSTVLSAVEDLQLTVETLLSFLHNIVRIALWTALVFLLASALTLVLP